MKTPLRGEMLRGADFIIGVVSARASDPIQTIFCDRHRAYSTTCRLKRGHEMSTGDGTTVF